MEAAPHAWPTLGALLLRDGLVSREDLEEVLSQQRDSSRERISGRRLGETLVERGLVTTAQVATLVAEQYELPFVELDASDVNLQIAALMPGDVARRLCALPVSVLPDDSVLVAVADPTNAIHSDDLRRILGRPLRFAVSTPEALQEAIAFVQTNRPEPRIDRTEKSEGMASVVVPIDEIDFSTGGSQSLVDVVRSASPHPPLGALLVRDGLLTEDEVDAALAQQRLTGSKRLGEILVERGAVTRIQVARLVAEQYELPFLDLAETRVDADAAALLSEETARRHCALPVTFFPDGSLFVAVADPTNALYEDDLRLALDFPLHFAVADPDELEAEIARTHGEAPGLVVVDAEQGTAPASDAGFALDEDEIEEDDPTIPALDKETEEVDEPYSAETPPPVNARSANEIADAEARDVVRTIERALALGATDIHVTPQPEGVVVRIRIDGLLRVLETYPTTQQSAISASLKSLTRFEDVDSDAPRQGRLALRLGDRETNLRVVILPTVYGEKATLHVLSEFSQPTALADLGLTGEDEEAFRRVISEASGLVLVCGPAGSGCTTTLYATIRELRRGERALATIEDPVRQAVSGIDQIAVDRASGLTFPAGLRGILLSDPDVVVVGELADSETAAAVVGAAVSGRLVLSRLRVASPAAAVERLAELGVERGPVSATLSCVLAQRLVRRICLDCREPYYPGAADLEKLGRPREEAGRRLLARGRGCVACDGTGFRGHAAIFELLRVTDESRELIARAASPAEIRQTAISAGMRTFRDEGIRVCLEGMTTVSELLRVTGEDVIGGPDDQIPVAHEDAEIARS